MEIVKVEGQIREDLGKKATKQLRKEGKVPCVLYGKDTQLHFYTDPLQLRPAIYTPDFKIVEIEIDGKSYRTIVKGIQFHPVTDELLHVDLQNLVKGRKVKFEVPIQTKGTSPGVRDGGRLVQTMRKLAVKATPDTMVNYLEVDISEMVLGDTARVRDIEKTGDFEILTPEATPIVSVQVPRSLKALETEDDLGVEGADEEAETAGAEEGAAAES